MGALTIIIIVVVVCVVAFYIWYFVLGKNETTPASIQLDEYSIKLYVSKQQQINILNANTLTEIQVTSDNANICSAELNIDKNSITIVGLAVGSTQVHVSSGSNTASIDVLVQYEITTDVDSLTAYTNVQTHIPTIKITNTSIPSDIKVTSSDTSVCTATFATPNISVQGVLVGQVEIIISAQYYESKIIKVRVIDPPVLNVSPVTVSVEVDKSVDMTITDEVDSWDCKIKDETIATASKSPFKITGVAAGKTSLIISGTVKDAQLVSQAIIPITVTPTPILLDVTPTSITFGVDNTETISITNTTVTNIIGKLADATVASIDENLMVTGIALGTTSVNITATLDGQPAAVTIPVVVTEIKLTASTVDVYADENADPGIVHVTSTDIDGTFTVSSSDETICTASISNKRITCKGIKAGETTIQVKGGLLKTEFNVVVHDAVSMKTDVESLTVQANKSGDITVTDSIDSLLAFVDDDTIASATIDASVCHVQGIKEGATTLTLKAVLASKKFARVSIPITVSKAETITLSASSITAYIDDNDISKVSLNILNDPVLTDIAAVSSDTDICTVAINDDKNKLVFSGVKEGTTTITVSSESIASSVDVAVTSSLPEKLEIDAESINLEVGETKTIKSVKTTTNQGYITGPSDLASYSAISNDSFTVTALKVGTDNVYFHVWVENTNGDNVYSLATIPMTITAASIKLDKNAATVYKKYEQETNPNYSVATVKVLNDPLPATLTATASDTSITASLTKDVITIKGVTAGQSSVTVSADDLVSSDIDVTVNASKDIVFDPTSLTLLVGQTSTMTIVTTLDTSPAPEISSNSTSIATVTSTTDTISVTGVAAGSTTLSTQAWISGEYAFMWPSITVTDPTTVSQTLYWAEYLEKPFTVATVTIPELDDVSVNSEDTSICTAAVSGTTVTITAVKVGNTTVSVKTGETLAVSITVTVSDPAELEVDSTTVSVAYEAEQDVTITSDLATTPSIKVKNSKNDVRATITEATSTSKAKVTYKGIIAGTMTSYIQAWLADGTCGLATIDVTITSATLKSEYVPPSKKTRK